MSPRKLILLSLALFVGVATFLVFRSTLTQKQEAPAPVETTEIMAAARDLPTGTILKEADVKWIPWPTNTDTSKLFVKGQTTMSSIGGAVLRDGLHGGEPLINSRVVQPREQGFLAAVLTPGMRAVSIALTPSGEVAGFIFPGDRVDVILSHSFNQKEGTSTIERHVSETVLSNVRVLALDQKSDSQTSDPKIAQLATLEVDALQAEKLALAADMIGNQSGRGTLSLALRSLATDAAASGEGAGGGLHGPSPTWDSDVSPAYPPVTNNEFATHKVQVIRGKDVSETTFKQRP